MGYAGFTNKGKDYNIDVSRKANAFAWGIDLGYEFKISNHAAVGFQLSTLAGKLKKLSVTENGHIYTYDLEESEYEHLGRIDLSTGIRFWF
jgi:hypothetical protein